MYTSRSQFVLITQVGEYMVHFFLSLLGFEFFFKYEIEFTHSYGVVTDTSVVLVFTCLGNVMTCIT